MFFILKFLKCMNSKLKSEVYDFQNLDKELEGKYRNNHFNGVGTISC